MESEKNSRILELFFRVLRGETVSVKAVAEEYGVSTKSVGRDIAKIQEFLTDHRDLMQQAELIYSYKDKAYHLSCDEFLKNKELFALVKVMLGSRCFSKEDVLRMIAKLKRFTTIQDREKFEKLVRKEVYHYHEVKSDCNALIDNLWDLIQMIDEKRLVTITYYKMNRENIKRKIKPVSLMFSEYYFYLIAYEADDEKYLPKFFRVDRIVAMTEHRERFTLERKYDFDEVALVKVILSFTLERKYDFDEGDLREKNQFLFPGKTEKIRFSFSGLSVQAILDRLPTAKVVEQNGNTSMIEAEVNHGRGIVMYLLSQGAWVKVLSPQSLVEEMQEELRQMCSAYDI